MAGTLPWLPAGPDSALDDAAAHRKTHAFGGAANDDSLEGNCHDETVTRISELIMLALLTILCTSTEVVPEAPPLRVPTVSSSRHEIACKRRRL